MDNIIKVGLGPGKKRLDEALGTYLDGDVIQIDPGRYKFTGFQMSGANLKIMGMGTSPDDVIIDGQLGVNDYSKISISNVKWISTDKYMCFHCSSESELILDRVILNVEMEGINDTQEVIYCSSATLTIKYSEIFSQGIITYISAELDSKVNIVGSIIDCIHGDSGTEINMGNTQIIDLVQLSDESYLTSKSLVDFKSRSNDGYSLALDGDSAARFNKLTGEETIGAQIDKSSLSIDNLLMGEEAVLVIDTNDESTIDIVRGDAYDIGAIQQDEGDQI